MSTAVKVKVQPGQTVAFPGICIHTLETAVATLPIQARRGRVTRKISVPISATCWRVLRAETVAERRWRLTGQLLAIILGLGAIFLAPYLIPPIVSIWLRLILGLVAAGVLVYLSLSLTSIMSLRYADPEKLAILSAVKMDHFSWRATTFAFANEAYAAKFRELNEPYLMDVDNNT